MKLKLPQFSLVLLIGPSGSGKSTFARRHFLATETVSSDGCRALVADDENDQRVTREAFEVLHFIVAKRLAQRRLTVVDATNVQREARASLLALAREHHALAAAIVLDMPENVCLERNRARPERNFGSPIISRQRRDLKRSLPHLKREGFRSVAVFSSPEELAGVTLERTPLWVDKRAEHGPFDIIGDVHGCRGELETLLARLGYGWTATDSPFYPRLYSHPEGRKALFVGDLVDRGPHILETLGLVKNMVEAGTAYCVPGNHEAKLLRKLRGKEVQVRHGLEATLAELDGLPGDLRANRQRELTDFLDTLVSHFVLDGGKLVLAHAGLPEALQGRASKTVREFALYGAATGETDALGLPVRHEWATDYRGEALVVYGHTPVPEPLWLNHTVNIDTGCVFGGALTALRYPELTTLSVPTAAAYAELLRPLAAPVTDMSAQQQDDDLLDVEDVAGKRVVSTRLRPSIVVQEAQSAAALEVLSRYAVNPKWLVYLPPTMAAPKTSARAEWLEHPDEAFSLYRQAGVSTLICEEKHMGSRAVVVLCRDEAAAKRRFGVADEGAGVVYSRTGRPFFASPELQHALLERLRDALTATDFWQTFATDWLMLDAELLPWSHKAQRLLEQRYAPVAAAARQGFSRSLTALAQAAARGADLNGLEEKFRARQRATERYADAYRRYCWPVGGVDDLQLAPFQLLGTEGALYFEKTHRWHLDTLTQFLAPAANLKRTAFREVTLTDEASVAEATAWWETLTGCGGEGMVVKPATPLAQGRRGPVQPGVKVRGQEYLRLVYGPEYLLPDNRERLRPRNVSVKRSLALQEFALGLETLERFVAREPLRRVHECVAAILALESEGLDPRL